MNSEAANPGTQPPVDDKIDYAVARIADIHACIGRGDEPLTHDQVRTIISNAAFMILQGAGMSREQVIAAMRDHYRFD